jgi:nitrite reductase/ring-hydroxylating ferredoxin subunit
MLGEARHGDVDPRLGAALAEGYTLPAAWYTEPAWFAREQGADLPADLAVRRAGRADCQPGDFFTAQVGTVPIIVTRDETGTVRAFVNVCRHRGSILVAEECGHGKIFQCPYHAWTYGLDGALRAAPGMREEASFDREQFSLFGLRAELWGTIHLRQPRRCRRPARRHPR